MKKLKFLILFLLPIISFGQQKVLLTIEQFPELRFSQTAKDTSIVKGESIVLGENLIITGGSGDYIYHWSPEESLNNPSARYPIANPASTTSYQLDVNDKTGCGFTIDYLVKVNWPTPVNLIAINNKGLNAVLYPNPNKGIFKIQFIGNRFPMIKLSILDPLGRRIFNSIITDFDGECIEELQVTFAPGVYILVATAGENKLYRQFIVN